MARTLDFSKLAIVYARQSTPEQVAQNIFSTESQLQLRDQALRDGFAPEQVLVIDDDLGVSGRTIAGRVGMTKALELMAQGLAGAVYAEDITRLSRDQDTVDHMIIARQCRRADVPLFMGGSWRDMRDYASRLAFKYEAVGASEQWGQTVEKLLRTKRKAAEQGRVVGRLPRGYRKNTAGSKKDPTYGAPVIHEEEAAIIRGLVQRLWEAGSVRALYAQTLPTYWPDGEQLSYISLTRMLKNPIYRGTFRWHDIEVPDNHPAIITPEEGREIDRLLALNKSTKRKPSEKPVGVLAGLLRCASHSRKMTQINHRQGRIYACHDRAPGKPNDYHFGIAAHRIEAIVLPDLWARLEGGLVDSIIQHLEAKRRDAVAVIDAGEAQRRILGKKVEGLSKALADPELSEIARRVVIAQLNEAAQALEASEARSGGVQAVDADLSTYQALRRDPEFLRTLPLTWDDQPMAWRRSWVRRFIERIDVTEGTPHRGVSVRYLDGRTSHLYDSPRGWTPEELALARSLMETTDRPPGRLIDWLEAQFKAKGYARRGDSIYKKIRRIEDAKHS